MRKSFVLLVSVLAWTTGCAHSWVPSLPAGHGQLSRAFGHHLDPEAEPREAFQPVPPTLFNPKAGGGVTQEAARAGFESAVALLKGAPTEAQVRQASVSLSVACVADVFEACAYLRANFQKPQRIEGPRPVDPPREMFMTREPQVAVIQGRVDTDGFARDLRVLESPVTGYAEAVAKQLSETRFQPATLAGHPIAYTYSFHLFLRFQLDGMTTEKELALARRRADQFTESTVAWTHLARMLADQTPEGPDYVEALRRLNVLLPAYWWSAGELAWHHVQAGRYAEAEPLARTARQMAPDNPYVLETTAALWRNTGRCAEALVDQQAAVTKLHEAWPQAERERFQRTLADYQRECAAEAKSVP
ncbi:hypothetical protein LZ198_38495 [Myxococcus sp. K15C18031901]|uniref:tetratricopeptide repeat protein n=1 Tax=Myxococcus dinghuensis TaxID=2906761 RepID=UPI0020A7B6CE|nr:hypothetical protein [Myxococcus dinghuensis]MCP3104772.1 hypothetical protein [Myxococcus dinghuensis]